MNVLMILPGLFSLLEKVVGPLLEGHAASIASKVIGLGSGASPGGILGAVEGVVGTIAADKKIELMGEIKTLLAQAQLQDIDSNKESFFRWGCRDSLEWALSIIVVTHLAIIESYNILALLHGGTFQPLDSLTTALLGGLLGLYGVGKVAEKYINNDSDT